MSKDQEPIRIALTIASRAEAAAPDLPTARGAQVAIDDLAQRRTGAAPIVLDLFDDGGDSAVSARLAEQIVADERYVAAVGPMGSDEAFANAPVFDRAGLLQVSPCASHPDLCRKGFKTFFRLVPNEEQQGSELARIAGGYLNARRVVTVADGDAFGRSVSRYFKDGCGAAGVEVVHEAFFDRGTTEFADLAQGVVEQMPDVVFFAVHQHEGKLVSAQIRSLGLHVPFLGTDGLKTTFFLGGGDEEGEAFHTHSGADFRRLPTAEAFRAAYVARFPEDSTYSPEAYDAVMLIAGAIDQASEPTRAAVLSEFKSRRQFRGITGDIVFDDRGERLGSPVSFYHVKLQDGQRVMDYLGTTEALAAAGDTTTVGSKGA